MEKEFLKKKFLRRVIAFAVAALIIVPTSVFPASAAVTLSKDLTLYLVPNTHLDTAWQHPFPQVANNTSYGIRPMFRNSTSALSEGDYRFTTSASAHLKMLKDYYNDDNPVEADRLWTKTKQLVDAGKLDLAGGQVTEPDLNIPSGEALARQSLYGQHFFLKNFTLDGEPYYARTGMVPDVFGFAGQVPQILSKSGMKYFLTSKVNWNGAGDGGGTAIGSSYDNFRTGSRSRDADIQYWQALDGESRLLSYFLYNDYNNTEPANSIQNVFNQNWADGENFHGEPRNTQVRTAMAFYGGGDFGQGMNSGLSGTGGNSFRHHESVAASTNGAKINVKTSTATQYFEETVANEDLSRLSYIDGEMYAEFHRGTYTTWARVKKYNRDNEILGESAEKAATIGFYTNSLATNSQQRLEDGWYKILINQMHDVLPGSALAWQYYLTFNQQELAKNLFNGVRDNALAALAYRADTNTSGKPVFVYNELSWPRGGEVTVSLRYDPLAGDPIPADGNVVIYDGADRINPTKVSVNAEKNRLTVTFMAIGIPATGYKVFDVRAEAPASRVTPLTFDSESLTIANQYLKVKFNPETGYISSLQSVVGGEWKEMFAQGVGTEGGELHIYKDCDEVAPYQNFDQWDLNRAEMNKEPDYIFVGKPLSIEAVCNTPEKVTVRVVKEWSGSQVAQDFTVYADSDRVDVHLAADWFHVKRLLKVSFPIAADTDYATFETSFGAVRRPTNRDNAFGAYRYEVPVHKWSDVTDSSGEYGVSILNDAKYGNDVLKKTVSNGTTFVRSRITVARTPRATNWASNGSFPPQAPYVIDSARHEFNYSIYPHADSWENSGTVNRAHELNYPLTAFEAAKGESHGLGAAASFASSDKPNVIISALKNQYDAPEDSDTVIVRVYESSGRDTDGVSITLPGNIVAGSAKEVDILEHDFDAAHGYDSYATKSIASSENTLKFDIKKYEVLTIQAKLAPSALPQLDVPQESVALAFNSRGVTPNANRRAGFLEGAGTGTSNAGRSMPQEHWPEGNKINYQGIEFNLGAPDDNNFMSGAEGANSVAVTPARGYSKAYIVGFAVASGGSAASANSPYSNDTATGVFTVNYAGENAAPTSKEITFSSWRSELSGWNRTAFADDKPYVLDSVAHFNGHYHLSSGASNSDEMYESDNYMFVYAIDIDETRTVSSIELPINPNIKIAAITLADPVEGFGTVYESADADPWDYSAPTPDAAQNVRVAYDLNSEYQNIDIVWDAAPNAVRYKLYHGITPNFVPSASNMLVEQGTLEYKHVGATLTGTQFTAGSTQFYYKVVAFGRANNAAEPSEPSAGIAPLYVDYALSLTGNSRVRANAQNSSETAAMAVNGNLTSKWCTGQGGTGGGISASNPAWLALDLTGSDTTVHIDRFELYHCGAGGEQASANTRAFNIKASTDTTEAMTQSVTNPNGTWETVVNVTANPNNSSGNVTIHPVDLDARFVRLYVTNPEGTPWSGAVRIYGFKAIGKNPGFEYPAPASTALDAKILQMPVLGDDNTFDQTQLSVDYDFYNEDADVTEGSSELKWYRKLADNYREYYTAIPIASAAYIPTTDELAYVSGYRCDITVYDSEGVKGKTITAETGVSVNVLEGAALVDFSPHGATNTAVRLVDGVNGGSNKWDVNTVTYPGPHWATFDMGAVRDIDSIKVNHANSYAAIGDYDADSALNTYDFDVSYSADGETWVTKQVRANTQPVTAISLDGPVKARFIKLSVITSSAYVVGQGTNSAELNYLSIRIGELEAFSSISNASSPVTLLEGGDAVSLADARGNAVDVASRFYANPLRADGGAIDVYAAAYGDSDELLGIGAGAASFDASGLFACTIEDFEVPAGAAKLKVFYWSDGAQVPISEAVLVR